MNCLYHSHSALASLVIYNYIVDYLGAEVYLCNIENYIIYRGL